MRTVQVYQPDSITGVLQMSFPGGAPSEVSGVQTLLQNIILFLRTKPGSDSFNIERGTVLGDPGTLSVALRNPNQVRVLISDAIDKTQTYIIAQQQQQRDLGQYIGPEATLTKLELNNIFQGEDPTSIFVELLVYTEGNQAYFLTV